MDSVSKSHQGGIERHIPRKTLKSKDSIPYITREIEKLTKRLHKIDFTKGENDHKEL